MRIKYLDWVNGLAENVPEGYTEELSEVQPGEEIVGTVPPDLRRFFGALTRFQLMLETRVNEHKAEHKVPGFKPEKCYEVHDSICEDRLKLEHLNDLFWQSLRHEVCLPDDVAIRRDWQLVKTEPEKPSPIEGMIIGILGGGRGN